MKPKFVLGLFTILIVATLALVSSNSITSVFAYGQGHPEQCQPCHGNITYTSDNINGSTYTMWSHNIQGGTTVWQQCTGCHTNYVQGTVHANLGCMGCHAVLHLGAKNSTGEWAAWIFAREPNITSLPVKAPAGITDWVLNETVFTQANYTGTYIQTIIDNLLTNDPNGMEIEVGVWNGITNEYISTSPTGTIGSESWKVCFSCHFISTNPARAGSYKLVGGVWKIGIPEYALKLPAHEITKAALAEAARSSSTETISPSTLLGILAGLLAIGLVVYSKREVWI